MNALQKLMKANVADLTKKPTQEYEVKRLSDLFGEPFTITLQGISADRFYEIRNMCLDKKGNIDNGKFQAKCLVAACIEPSLKDKDLLKHYGCVTPDDLVMKLFNIGEIDQMGRIFTELSGITSQADTDAEIKN